MYDYYNYGGYGDLIGAGQYGSYNDMNAPLTKEEIEKARKDLHELYEILADDGIY